jgi:hypothetical protein
MNEQNVQKYFNIPTTSVFGGLKLNSQKLTLPSRILGTSGIPDYLSCGFHVRDAVGRS